MHQAKLQDSTSTVSQNQEQFAITWSPLKKESTSKKGKWACRWVRDERSQLYCQWFVE